MNNKDYFPDSQEPPTHLAHEHTAPRTMIHEIRNLLAPISNAANLLRLKNTADGDLLPIADLIERNVRMIGQVLGEFSITTAPASSPPTDCLRSANAHRNVLIADDNRDFRSTLQSILTAIGYEVKVAADGEEAMETATSWKPDCVLLDAHMPKLNGYEVARKLRSQFPKGTMSIVLLSGDNLDPETMQSAKSFGFDHCLDKIDDTGLKELLGSGR